MSWQVKVFYSELDLVRWLNKDASNPDSVKITGNKEIGFIVFYYND